MYKKIGILTYHRALSWGAILQAYALSIAFKKLGVSTEVLDYRCDKIENTRCILKDRQINLFVRILKFFLQLIILYKFFHFSKRKLKISKIQFFKKDLNKSINLYDKIIVGSDQVWEPLVSDSDSSYFLDFEAPRKFKNSYAVSFFPFVSQMEKSSLPLIDQFDSISVRESVSQAYLQGLMPSKKVYCHIDPVFLLHQKHYLHLLKRKPVIKKKQYILVCAVKMNKKNTTLDFVEALAKQENLSIKIIAASFYRPLKGEYCYTVGPIDFIDLIVNAKYVVTGSFHCTAFSIIFHKNFFADWKYGGHRLTSICKRLKLESCLLGQSELKMQIDWEKVDKLIEKERDQSLKYLKSLIFK